MSVFRLFLLFLPVFAVPAAARQAWSCAEARHDALRAVLREQLGLTIEPARSERSSR